MTPSELPSVAVPMAFVQRRRMWIFIGLALVAGAGLAWTLERNGERSYQGSLQSRTTLVTSSCSARIREVSVKSGQTVSPGDPLFQLVDVQLEDRLIAKRREIAELEAENNRAKTLAEIDFAWRRRELQSEIFETQLKVAAFSQERLNKQVEKLAWKEHLTGSDSSISSIVAEMDHPFKAISNEIPVPDDRRLQAMLREDAATTSAETLSAQIELCEHRLKSLASLEKELETKIRAASGIDVNEARLSGAKLELAALDNQRKELTTTSATYGTVVGVRFQSGDRVPDGEALIEILDDVQPHVIAEIPTAEVSKVRQGAKVSLVFPSNDRRIGIVSQIPPQTSAGNGTSDSRVAVRIEPAGKIWPKLAIGSNVKVLLP